MSEHNGVNHYQTMKLSQIITLLVATLFFAGCASKETASTSEEAGAATGAAAGNSTAGDQGAGEKTAFDGSTGSGLLMERYKSGQIEGFRE
jgi:PBP1b-binding outer membrane lipoprotein LpoB